MPFNKYRKNRRRYFIFPFIALFFALIIGGLVMLLWNAILPSAINARRITYWQAIGLLILCRILFGGFKQWGYGRSGWKGGRWRDKWINMTPEERQKFQDEWKSRCAQKKEDENKG